jgi:hypothetical protein
MFNELPTARTSFSKRFALVCMLLSLSLIAAACDGTAPNSTATPTVMGLVAELASPPTGQPNAVTTPASGGPGETDDSVTVGEEEYPEVDVCALATDAQVEVVLGQSITSRTPGAEPDSVSGGTLYFCSYVGSGLAVVISWVDTGSPAAAEVALQEELAQMQADDPSATVASQSGIADQAFWTVTTDAAGYVVVIGGNVIGVLLGGDIGDPAAHKDALKTLAESIVAGM